MLANDLTPHTRSQGRTQQFASEPTPVTYTDAVPALAPELWTPVITAVVTRRSQALLAQVPGSELWSPISGLLLPGEEPADAAVRLVFETTGLEVVPKALAMVQTTHAEDSVGFNLNFVFALSLSTVAPDGMGPEAANAQWCSLDDLPKMSDQTEQSLEYGLDFCEVTAFKFRDEFQN